VVPDPWRCAAFESYIFVFDHLCIDKWELILKYIFFISIVIILSPRVAWANEDKVTTAPGATSTWSSTSTPGSVTTPGSTATPISTTTPASIPTFVSTPTPRLTPTPVAQRVSPLRSGLSVGVGWPYLGLKYFFNQDFGGELRFATGQGINVWAARGYWSFAKFGDFRLVTGLEGGYVTFNTLNANNTLVVTGTGYEFAPFCGLEYFFSRQLSFLFDFSAPFIGVNSGNAALEDLQWVVNGGIYLYPF